MEQTNEEEMENMELDTLCEEGGEREDNKMNRKERYEKCFALVPLHRSRLLTRRGRIFTEILYNFY